MKYEIGDMVQFTDEYIGMVKRSVGYSQEVRDYINRHPKKIMSITRKQGRDTYRLSAFGGTWSARYIEPVKPESPQLPEELFIL